MQRMLEYNGIDPKRFQAKWISGSEAAKFRDTITRVSAEIKELGPNGKFVEEWYTEDQMKEMEAFFAENDTAGSENAEYKGGGRP